MSECDARYAMFPRCKFEPRYDFGVPDLTRFKTIPNPAFIEALKPKTYLKDVCIRCGKTVKRED